MGNGQIFLCGILLENIKIIIKSLKVTKIFEKKALLLYWKQKERIDLVLDITSNFGYKAKIVKLLSQDYG